MEQHGKHRIFAIALALMAPVLLASANAQEAQKSKLGSTSKLETLSVTPTVRTASGVVRGVTEGEVSSFKGIPYAAAPIGASRWRPTQPLPPWQRRYVKFLHESTTHIEGEP